MELSSELLLIQLDQNMHQINEESIKRPISYENLRQFIIVNFKINSFTMYYLDKTNKEINITNNEEFKKTGDIIFIVECKSLNESFLDKIYPNLSESKMDIIDEKFSCNLCLEKLTENPYYCYQCPKRICKKCLIDLNKRTNPLKCPFCQYELPFEKWLTLKNFVEERQHDLELIEENLKLKDENLIIKRKENELLKQIKILNTQLKESNEKIKYLKMEIQKNNEEINKLKEEIKKFKNEINNLLQIERKLLEKEEKKINKLKEEKNDLSDLQKKPNDKNNEIEILNPDLNETQNYNEDYFIYNVEEDHIDENGYVNILGENFVNNNKGTLIINGKIKLNHLVSKYKLQIGINGIKIIMDKNQNINFCSMFYYCKSLKDITPLKNWNVSKENNFSNMFSYCISLNKVYPLKNWNVSNGKNFNGMFYYCKLLNNIYPLKNWNVSNGNNFNGMFCCCESLSDLTALKNWDVSNGNNFSEMFSGCYSLNDIFPLKNWNVINGNDFSEMFSFCYSLNDISSLKDWKVVNGNNFDDMFFGLKKISKVVINNFKRLNSNFDDFN